jgi:superfamily II DNA or RNA helicase
MDATYHVLGVSATPSRLDGRGLGERWDSLVIGPGVREMIDAGVLSDYVLYRASVPPQTKLRKGVGGDYSSGDALQSVRTVTAGASKQWTEKCPGAQTLAFACTVEHAEQIAAEFTAATSERAAMISGDTPADQRRELMQRFRDRDIRLIASCDVFSEGLDVPGVECAILLRPTASLTLYMQQIGRAMRRKDRPAVILDMAGNSHRHGLPCEPRDWSLDGGVQRPASPPTPRQCGACFAAAPAHATVCPGCGRAWPKKKLEIVEVDAELIEAMKRSEERRNAATLEALKKIARQRGYKPGWAEHVMAARSRKRARA